MGALEYKPQLMHAEKYEDFDFDWLSLQCEKNLERRGQRS